MNGQLETEAQVQYRLLVVRESDRAWTRFDIRLDMRQWLATCNSTCTALYVLRRVALQLLYVVVVDLTEILVLLLHDSKNRMLTSYTLQLGNNHEIIITSTKKNTKTYREILAHFQMDTQIM